MSTTIAAFLLLLAEATSAPVPAPPEGLQSEAAAPAPACTTPDFDARWRQFERFAYGRDWVAAERVLLRLRADITPESHEEHAIVLHGFARVYEVQDSRSRPYALNQLAEHVQAWRSGGAAARCRPGMMANLRDRVAKRVVAEAAELRAGLTSCGYP